MSFWSKLFAGSSKATSKSAAPVGKPRSEEQIRSEELIESFNRPMRRVQDTGENGLAIVALSSEQQRNDARLLLEGGAVHCGTKTVSEGGARFGLETFRLPDGREIHTMILKN
jgi:hypothetical protein